MRASALAAFAGAALAAVSCDMYLDNIGEEGELCSTNGSCYYGLMCVHGTCSEAPGIGEACDLTHYSWDQACEGGLLCIQTDSGPACGEVPDEGDSCLCADESNMPLEECSEDQENEAICADGLGCFEGVCVAPLPAAIEQPGSTKLWTRCPLGMEWDGWRCQGEAKSVSLSEATDSCPSGFQVPTADDFIAILDNCDSEVPDDGACDSCASSSECHSMFTNQEIDIDGSYWLSMGETIDTAWYWTTTEDENSYPDGEYFLAKFEPGPNNDTFQSFDPEEGGGALTLCVQY